MPRSGGAYVFITQAFGPAAGSVMGTGLWLSLVLKSAFALVGLGAYLALVSDLDLRLVALGMLAIMTALNLRGIDKVSKAQSAIVWFSVVALSVLLGVAIPSADPQMLPPLAPNGVSGFFETVALVFVAYAGVTKVAAIAGEVQNPGRNLPRGILWAMGFITPLYAAIVLLMLATTDRAGVSNSLTPVHSMTEVLMGDVAAKVAVVLGVLVMFAMANAGLLTASRFPFAMGKDGLLPPTFAELGRTGSTPVRCILLTSGAMTCAVLSSTLKASSSWRVLSNHSFQGRFVGSFTARVEATVVPPGVPVCFSSDSDFRCGCRDRLRSRLVWLRSLRQCGVGLTTVSGFLQQGTSSFRAC